MLVVGCCLPAKSPTFLSATEVTVVSTTAVEEATLVSLLVVLAGVATVPCEDATDETGLPKSAGALELPESNKELKGAFEANVGGLAIGDLFAETVF